VEPVPECDMQFARPEQVAGRNLKKLGEARVKTRGLSFECREYVLLDIIRTETCARDANLAVIRSGKNPTPRSACYRLEADFYRVDSASLEGYARDSYDEPYAMRRRMKNFSNQLRSDMAVIMGSVAFVLAAGYWLVATSED
jgi:hypothetical protein